MGNEITFSVFVKNVGDGAAPASKLRFKVGGETFGPQYDIPALVHKARVPEGYLLINLGAWNNDPIVIQAIKEKALKTEPLFRYPMQT